MLLSVVFLVRSGLFVLWPFLRVTSPVGPTLPVPPKFRLTHPTLPPLYPFGFSRQRNVVSFPLLILPAGYRYGGLGSTALTPFFLKSWACSLNRAQRFNSVRRRAALRR